LVFIGNSGGEPETHFYTFFGNVGLGAHIDPEACTGVALRVATGTKADETTKRWVGVPWTSLPTNFPWNMLLNLEYKLSLLEFKTILERDKIFHYDFEQPTNSLVLVPPGLAHATSCVSVH
jgi:hypothetical protein